MQSFLTGSRVYGIPRPDSDIDLCVLMSYSEMRILVDAHGREPGEEGSALPRATSLRFGSLNLLVTFDEGAFSEWKIATDDLSKVYPVTRDDAIEHFKKCEAERIVKKTPKEEAISVAPVPPTVSAAPPAPYVIEWWVSFATRGPACVLAVDELSAGDIAAELTKCVVTKIQRLPYKATPVLNGSPDYAFCWKPNECAGRSSCPRRPSCTD